MNEVEKHRKIFRPKKVRVLFIGESAPKGGSFFYYANSILYNAIFKSFRNVYGEFESNIDFLKFFALNDFYLDDLCLKPINHLDIKLKKTSANKVLIPLANALVFIDLKK